MNEKPLLLDLFCGAGGAGMGYHLAGFEVVGVDIAPQPNYPFQFYQADAVKHLERMLSVKSVHWAAIHASPPCQAYSWLTTGTNQGRHYPRLIDPVRELLIETGLPWIIENVQGSGVRRDLTLCGEMFGLDVLRHRWFEISGFRAKQPDHLPHRGRVGGYRHGIHYEGPYKAVYGDGGGKGSITEWQRATGVDWTTDRREIAESIPPAYTRHVGNHLMKAIRAVSGTPDGDHRTPSG